MYLLIVCLPLIGTIFSGLFGYKLGVHGATRITVYCITLAFVFSLIAFYEVALMGSVCYIEFFKWFDSELLTFSWGFMFDTLTVVMLVVVTSISMCVHLYSTEYMSNDPHVQRFMAYLSLFTFFMLILVTADNFFQLFLGWEGVGLCSYLLVNFWFGRIQANKAAIKAMVVNRVGDIGLALGIFLIYYMYKTIDYTTVFALVPQTYKYTISFFGYEISAISLVCFFFFVAATGKSAQIGLHTWLPDAMEGPTPVSALIHAATMVTAGVFLIVRCSPLFEYAPTVSLIVTISGAMTAFMAASIGLVQNDLKRVIAYSTCSQLGYMMIACGTSGYAVGMFHLTNHAFFKALLFLSAGSVIHALADEQDMRKMGGLLNMLPFTYSMMLIGSLSLMGFPFLTGFYSKDLILEWTFSQFSINGLFAYWMGSISAFFTAFYSLRVICLTFLKKPSAFKANMLHVHEAPLRMAAPLLFLSFFSIFIGYFLKDMFVGLGTDFWGNSIFVLPQNVLLLEAEFLDTSVKIFPVILSLCGASLAFCLYNFFFKTIYLFKLSFIGRHLYIFFNRKWFFDKIYNYILAHNILTWSYKYTYQNLDRGIFELIGPTGLYKTISVPSFESLKLYNNNILSINKIRPMYSVFVSMIIGLLFFNYFFFNSFWCLNWNFLINSLFPLSVEEKLKLFSEWLANNTSNTNEIYDLRLQKLLNFAIVSITTIFFFVWDAIVINNFGVEYPSGPNNLAEWGHILGQTLNPFNADGSVNALCPEAEKTRLQDAFEGAKDTLEYAKDSLPVFPETAETLARVFDKRAVDWSNFEKIYFNNRGLFEVYQGDKPGIPSTIKSILSEHLKNPGTLADEAKEAQNARLGEKPFCIECEGPKDVDQMSLIEILKLLTGKDK